MNHPPLERSTSARSGEYELERYRYILQQLNSVNENVHRYLTVYQTLATALGGGALLVFASRTSWGLTAATAKASIIGLLSLLTLVGLFCSMLIFVGMLSWLDYRREECELTDEAVYPGFRKPPNRRNFIRWHETYIIAFILTSTILLWVLTLSLLLPSIT
ncbi:cell division septal protein FtsQ [Allocatelliglobosispora scoriae]|uniref:Cell division septal protein FtsQ n=1 Tax=Allocatelliglobosispora scoriae TaxID=643052 RepID=A0A841C3Y1_9ACTN|nr:hypothetical protein [Allocatelliglobosispora scoriae]MBB5874019.1 cell division septal protein FtsQ [Allocatelliglobosispora scoriae]